MLQPTGALVSVGLSVSVCCSNWRDTLTQVAEEQVVDDVEFDFAASSTPDGVVDGTVTEVAESKYTLVNEKWNKRVGKQLSESEVNDLQVTQMKGRKDKDAKPPEKLNEFELADAFTMCFEPLVKFEEKPQPASAAWFKDFAATDDARKLRQSTLMDHELSELAAWHIARNHHEYLAKADENAGTDQESISSIGERNRSIRKALRDAGEDVETMECVTAGLEKGVGSRLPRKELAEAFKRAKQSERLMGILKGAGKMVQYAKARRKERVDGVDDVTGITIGGDVSRMLASEMCLMGDELRELDLMRRIIEKQVFQVERSKEIRVGHGPVVVVLDESGSMDGNNIINAKSFALTMAWLAKIDKRWISLVGFSSHGEYNYLTMPPDAWDQEKMLNWMDHFFGGGTDFNVLQDVADNWKTMGCPVGKTDVIFITDACASFSDTLVKKFSEWRIENDVKCYGISVAASVGQMGMVCDHVSRIDNFGMDSSTVREILATI